MNNNYKKKMKKKKIKLIMNLLKIVEETFKSTKNVFFKLIE